MAESKTGQSNENNRKVWATIAAWAQMRFPKGAPINKIDFNVVRAAQRIGIAAGRAANYETLRQEAASMLRTERRAARHFPVHVTLYPPSEEMAAMAGKSVARQ
ncbi:MAG: hypothetical protein AAB573_03845 [Patescibacteria group bacterium]